MKPASKLAAVAALFVLGGFGLRSACNAVSTDASDVLVGRIWLDHIPTKPNEHAEWFVVIDQGGDEGQGVFSRASQFEGAFSVFGWKGAKSGELTVEMLQDKTRHTVKYKAEKCDKDGFDYCLELIGAPKGAARYGSKRGWELSGTKDVASLPAALGSLDLE